MCTMIAHQVKIQGRGKNGPEWFEVREANVSYDHPYDLPLEHALNIDFVNEALGPGARVAVELSVEGARQLVKIIEAVLAQADQRGVLEDRPLAASLVSDAEPGSQDRGSQRIDDTSPNSRQSLRQESPPSSLR